MVSSIHASQCSPTSSYAFWMTSLIPVLCLCVSLSQSNLQAADPVVNASSLADSNAKDPQGKSKRSTIEPELEKRAQELVDSHLPELNKLLQRLKSDSPRQYEMAIRDLAKSARRLDSAKNRDQELYEIEVELLKTQSNLKIYTAKLKVRDNDADRQSLRKAAQRLLNAEIARADYNVRLLDERAQRAAQLLSSAKDRLSTLQRDGDSQLDKKVASLLRSAGRQVSPSDAAAKTKPKRRNALENKPKPAKD